MNYLIVSVALRTSLQEKSVWLTKITSSSSSGTDNRWRPLSAALRSRLKEGVASGGSTILRSEAAGGDTLENIYFANSKYYKGNK